MQLRSQAIKRFIRWVLVLGLVLALKPPYPHTAAQPVTNVNNQVKVEQKVQPVTTKAQPVIATPAPSPQPAQPEPTPVETVPEQTIPSGGKYDWMSAAGISPDDYAAVDYIISHESSWNPNATNPNGGAHGLPQALPYSKTGCGWVDAVCQLRWASQYADNRYGGWQGALNFWQQHRWW